MINPEGSPHFMGLDKFVLFFGIVEDRDDPLMLGRVRIRIFGVHPDDKALVPTEDLPWAFPIMPITSANVSGIGNTPVGVLPGSTVVGFFADGMDRQIPMFFGTMSGGTGHFSFSDVMQDTNREPTGPYNTPIAPGKAPLKAAQIQKGVWLAKRMLQEWGSIGMKPYHAAAICGNLMQESNFSVATNTRSGAYGYAQWLGVRKQAYQKWRATIGAHFPDEDTANAEYVIYEINHPPKGAVNFTAILHNLIKSGPCSIHGGLWANVYDTSNVNGATVYWCAAYEAPGKGEAKLGQRVDYANQILTAMSITPISPRAAGKTK
jgi:hypothetical protein